MIEMYEVEVMGCDDGQYPSRDEICQVAERVVGHNASALGPTDRWEPECTGDCGRPFGVCTCLEVFEVVGG